MSQSKNTARFGNCFVTGATGLLGSELVRQLLDLGEAKQVVCLVRDGLPRSRFYSLGLDKRVVTVRGDLLDQALLTRVMNEYDIETVFHLGAQTLVGHANRSPAETLDVNIRGTWQLLEAARLNSSHVKTVLFASSDKAYGDLDGERYTESFPLAGKHPYDVSKSCADLIAQTYAHTYGLNIGITRCGNFFGPGDLNLSRIFPSTVLAVLEGRAPEIRSDGTPIRDYIYIEDGASAYRALAGHIQKGSFRGEAFNFSYGLRLSVLQVVEKILEVMNSPLKPRVLNEASNEIKVQALDSAKAMKLLNWKPEWGFEEGIRRTVEWYTEYFRTEKGL